MHRKQLPLPLNFRKKDYSQNPLIVKINEYRKQEGLPPLDEGQCHGLGLWWLEEKDNGNGLRFYRTKKHIIELPVSKFKRKEVDRFIEKMDSYQNPEKIKPGMQYFEIAKMMDAEKQIDLDSNYLARQLECLFRKHKKDHNMICISSRFADPKEETHTVAVYIENGWYVYFDANDDAEKARKFPTATLLTEKVQKSLYDEFGLPRPVRMSLEVKVVSNPSKHTKCGTNAVKAADIAKPSRLGMFKHPIQIMRGKLNEQAANTATKKTAYPLRHS